MIVFDLDDTLYKEIDFWHSGMRAVARAAAPAAKAPWLYDKMMSTTEPLTDAISAASQYSGISEYDLVDTYRYHNPEISLDPEAAYTLASLRNRGYHLALITDGRSRSQRLKIKALDLGRFIPSSRISISEEIGADKNTPTPFVRLMDMYPEEKEWVYVGDNPQKDFFHPNSLGWTTIMLEDKGTNLHWQTLGPGGEYAAQRSTPSLLHLLDFFE